MAWSTPNCMAHGRHSCSHGYTARPSGSRAFPTPSSWPSQHRTPRRCGAASTAESGPSSSGRRQPVQRFNFEYMSQEQAADQQAASDAAWQAGMQEYEDLKAWLLFRTWRSGLLFSGYLLLAASGEAAFCELIGAAAGYGYLKLLIADVSRYKAGDRIPGREADSIEPALARGVAKLAAAYRQALRPRLLVLPGLLAACAAWNVAVPEVQLTLVEQGCMIAGFLSWKIALALKIYEDLKPRPLTAEQLAAAQRPELVQVDDVAPLDLRELAQRSAAQRAAAEGEPASQAEGQQQLPAGVAASPLQQLPAQQQQQATGPQA